MDWEVWEMNSLLLFFFVARINISLRLKVKTKSGRSIAGGFLRRIGQRAAARRRKDKMIEFNSTTQEKKEPALLPARSSVDDSASGINNVFNRAFVSLSSLNRWKKTSFFPHQHHHHHLHGRRKLFSFRFLVRGKFARLRIQFTVKCKMEAVAAQLSQRDSIAQALIIWYKKIKRFLILDLEEKRAMGGGKAKTWKADQNLANNIYKKISRFSWPLSHTTFFYSFDIIRIYEFQEQVFCCVASDWE